VKKKILISTGGSGGHVIPAMVFYDHLKNDFEVFLSTDKRGAKFLNFKKYKIKIINTPKLINNFFLLPYSLFLIILLIAKSLFFLKKKNIDILISTGGYMSLPLCVAAKILNIKIYLFEPNMVLGRANKFFLKFSEKIFCYSNKIKKFTKKYSNKIILTGPLLRKEFYSIKSYKSTQIGEQINLLIIGGSQGAKLFDYEIKKTIITLSKKYKLKVIHQTSFLNYKNLKKFYTKNSIDNQLFDFDQNILKYIKKSNLCITRGGASTLSELTFLNIPYLAIPYPFAKDDHQLQNALFYKNKNCCWVLTQDKLDQNILTSNLIKIIRNKDEYLLKKKNMKNFSYQNTWNNINQNLINIINEN
jgi:UDP-N-acetylglucosamine--N-acetylmuramyl-(pentapeptide) pyrophosphoryl-undecaprenol N-acetylglucosamine transferase|tara:strand:- start:273 stop:1349 length:1077 start_codon:yes stop_codon:yes gene_type:complete